MALHLGELTLWMNANTTGFDQKVDKSVQKLDKFAASARKAAAVATAALAAIGTAGGYLIKVASDAEELDNVIGQAFGHMSKEINAWAKDTGSQMQRSTYQMREYAGISMAMLKPMLGNADAAAEMAKQVAKLSVDMGSFWNVADDEAFRALRSAISGEIEPMKRFGIVLTDATLEVFALSKGIDKAVSSMTQAEKAALRWEYIMEATKDVQGDAVRTAGSFSNQLKGLGADVRNIAEDYGKLLLPAATEILSNVKDLTGWFSNLDEAQRRQIVQWGALAAAVLGGVAAFGLIVTAISLAAKAFGLVMTPALLSIGALVIGATLLYAAWNQDWLGIQTKLSSLWTTMEPLVDAARELGHKALKTIWDWIVGGLDQLSYIIDDAWPIIKSIPANIAKTIEFVVHGIAAVIDAAGYAVSKLVEWTINVIQLGLHLITDILPKTVIWLISVAQEGLKAVIDIAAKTVIWLISVVQQGLHTVIDIAAKIVTWVISVAQEGLHAVVDITAKAVTWLIAIVQEGLHSIVDITARFVTWLISVTQEGLHSVVDIAAKFVTWLITVVQEGAKDVIDISARFITWLIDVVQQGLEGIVHIPAETIKWIVRVVQEFARNFIDVAARLVVWTVKVVQEIAHGFIDVASRWVSWIVKVAQEIAHDFIDITTRVIAWTVHVAQEIAHDFIDIAAKVVTWVVKVGQEIAHGFVDLTSRFIKWVVGVTQDIAAGFVDIAARVVTWVVKVAQEIGQGFVWVVNQVVDWAVNLVKGSAEAVSDWFAPKLEWVARLVNVVAGAGNAASEWLLSLVGGEGKPVEVDVPVKPTILEGWGTNLNNWLSTTLEGLQWQEITKEQFDKLTEEYGEQADQMLRQEGGKYYVRTSEKVEILMDMALGVATFLAGRSMLTVGSTVFSVIQKALKSVLGLFMGDLVGGWAVPVAVGAAITWTLMPEDIREKIRGLFGLDLQSTVREAFPDVAQLIDEQQLTEITNLVVKYADAYGFAKDQVAALVKQESDFRDVGNSLSTAVGPLQITQTALNDLARLGIDYDVSTLEGRVEAAVKYLQVLRDHYKLTGDELIAAYYAGPTYIKKHGITDDVIFGQISPRQYVEEYKAELAKLREAAQLDLSEVLGISANIALGVTVAADIGRTTWALLQAALVGAGMKMPNVIAGMKALGAPGAIAVVSIAADLLDNEKDWTEMGIKLVAALAVGIGIGAFTGSPYMGALAFDIVYNLIPGQFVNAVKGWMKELRNPSTDRGLPPVEIQAKWLAKRDELPPETQAWMQEQVDHLNDLIDIMTNPPGLYGEFHEGAILPGTDGPDKYPALVAPGEAIVPSRAVRKGWVGVLDWFRSMGVPGFATGKPPVIATGNTQIDAMLASTGGWLDSLNETISAITNTVKDVFINFFTWLGELLVTIAKQFLSEEKFAELENAFNGLKERVQGILDAWRGGKKDEGGAGEDEQKDAIEEQLTLWQKVFKNLKTQIEDINTQIEQADWSVEIQHIMSGVVDGLKSSTSEIAHTIAGMADHIMLALNDWRQALSNVVSMMVTSLVDLFANNYASEYRGMTARGKELFPDLSDMFKNYRDWDKNLEELKQIQRNIDTATVGGGIIGGLIGLIFGPIGAIIGAGVGALGGRAAASASYADQIDELKAKLGDTLQAIKEALGTTMSDIAQGLASAFSADTYEDFTSEFASNLEDMTKRALITAFMATEPIRGLVEQLSDAVTFAVEDAKITDEERSAIMSIYNQIAAESEWFHTALQDLGIAAENAAESLSDITRNIPAGFKIALTRFEVAEPVPMASGGIVTRPTYALIGEAGPEAVIPLDEQMGVSVTINVHGNVYADDLEKRIEDTVYRAAKRSRLGSTGLAGGYA